MTEPSTGIKHEPAESNKTEPKLQQQKSLLQKSKQQNRLHLNQKNHIVKKKPKKKYEQDKDKNTENQWQLQLSMSTCLILMIQTTH